MFSTAHDAPGDAMDDIRHHDAKPTEQETEWLAGNAVQMIVRVIALAGIAVSVGVGASLLLDGTGLTPPVVAESAR